MKPLTADISNIAIRAFDIALSAILLALLSPVFLIVALLVMLFIGRPPFHLSRRVGKNGTEYTHVKFKSMLPGKEIGRVFFEQDRLNRTGRFIRKLHLDELPELFNILAGTMSFVGPRPLPRSLLEGLDPSIRQRVPPGWTGPAQLWLAEKGSLNKHRQIALDNRYVETKSLTGNLKILGQTFLVLCKRTPLDENPDSSEDRVQFRKRVKT